MGTFRACVLSNRQPLGRILAILVPLYAVLTPSTDLSAQAVSLRLLKELSLEDLARIDVTQTTKVPDTIRHTPAAVSVLTNEDIRRSGATTLPDLLRQVPGVIVNQSDANRWAVGIRGFADIFSKSLLVLIDGRSLYTPLVGGVHWAIQDVVLADIDRIEIVRGTGGSVWGANAVNGVINIITRRADQTQGLRVTAATGTTEHGRLEASFGGGAGNTGHYRVYGKWFRRGAQYHADAADFDTWRSAQAGFRTDWRSEDAEDEVTLSGDAYSTNVGERAQVSFFEPVVIRTSDDRIDLSGGNVLAHWTRHGRAGARLRLQGYVDVTGRRGFTFSERRTTLDAEASATLPSASRHRVSMGGGVRWSPSEVTQVVPTLTFFPEQRTYGASNGYVQDDIELVPQRLSVAIGLKAEHNTYSGASLLPSVSVTWAPSPRQTVWAAANRAVRAPSRFERDLRFFVLLDPAVPLYALISGNESFQAEVVTSTEGGYRALVRDNFYVDVAGFTSHHTGLSGFGEATLRPQTDPLPFLQLQIPFENNVDADARGIEVAPEWRPTRWWQVRGSYSFLALDAESAGTLSVTARENYVGLAPRHQWRLSSRINLPRQFEFDQAYRFVDALPAHSVPDYHSLDVRVGWSRSPRVAVNVVGQNLLQSHHAEFGAVPVQIRRSVYAGLTFTD